MPEPSVLVVFLDGVGLGEADAHNPLSETYLPAFEQMVDGQPWTADAAPVRGEMHLFRPIDATLGKDGLPQSGTGQATLFTGTNCAKIVGQHFGPFPHSETKPVLETENVFRKVKALRADDDGTEPAAFANAYPPRFFSRAEEQDRWTVTTLCCRMANVRLRTEDDLRAGRALPADLTGTAWREHLGCDVPVISEAEAGQRLAAVSREHAFTLFEYYLTDKVGHGRLADRSAGDVLRSLDRFFEGLLDTLDTERQLLIVTSDHGNIEDLSVKTHTLAPVPLVAYGRGADRFHSVHDLTGVTPAARKTLAHSG